MHETAIRLVGGAVLVVTVGLLGAVGYEQASFMFGESPLAAVPLSQTQLVSLVVLLVGLLAFGMLFWFQGRSSHNGQYNGGE